MVPSKKARLVALGAAALAFLGTLAVFARADDPQPPPRKKFVIVAVRDDCVDYHVGQKIELPASAPDEAQRIDRGGANDDIYVAPDPNPGN